MAWTTFAPSTTIRSAEVNANFGYAEGDIVPHSAGTLANGQFNLGTTTALWNTLYALSVNAATLLVSSTSKLIGNVGIGHINPSQTLDVSGASIFTGNTRVNTRFAINHAINTNFDLQASGNNDGFQFYNQSGNLNAFLYQTSDSNGSHFGLVHALSGTIVQLSSDTSKNNYIARNFAVGHANPSQTLDVSGNVAIVGNLSITGALDLSGQFGALNINLSQTFTSDGDKQLIYIRSTSNGASGNNDNFDAIRVSMSYGNSQTLNTHIGFNLNDISKGTSTASITNMWGIRMDTLATAGTSIAIQTGNNVSDFASNTIWIDGMNRKIGINTRTPSQTLDVSGTLAVTGATTFSSTLDLSGNLTARSNLSVTAAAGIGGAMNVSGAVSLLSTLAVSGSVTMSSTLNVTGDIYSVAFRNYFASSTIVGCLSYTTSEIYFKKIGKTVFVQFFLASSNANASTMSFTLEYPNLSGVSCRFPVAFTKDENVNQIGGYGLMGNSGTSVEFTKSYTGGAWTATGIRVIEGQFFYETP